MLLHWSGVAVFITQFRRPLFSVLQEVVHQALLLNETIGVSWEYCRDEADRFTAYVRVAFTNIRAQFRRTIWRSDASEDGGGTAEPSVVVHWLRHKEAS